MLEGRTFVCYTNHKLLTFAFLQKPEKSIPRQLKQLSYISQFSSRIEHIRSLENIVLDISSRIATIEAFSMYTELANAQKTDMELYDLLSSSSRLKFKKVIFEDFL